MATPIPTNRAAFSIDDVGGRDRRHDREARLREPRAVGIVTDSRGVTPGNVFVALRGETHDGHAFLDAGLPARARRGSRRARPCADGPTASASLEVDDTLVALGELAAHISRRGARSAAANRVVAITGQRRQDHHEGARRQRCSARSGRTHFTAGNLNNRVGVPFVVLGIQPEHRFAVLEMGMSLPGELDAITSFARPDVSVVTNVGVAHAEGVGGPDGVMREKGAVYRALDESGVAIVNADDECATRAADRHARAARRRRSAARRARRIGSFAASRAARSGRASCSRRPVASSRSSSRCPAKPPRSISPLRSRRRRPRAACSCPAETIERRARHASGCDGRATVTRLGRGHRRPRRHLQREPGEHARGARHPRRDRRDGRRQRRGPRRDEGARRRTPRPSTSRSATRSPRAGVALAIGCGGLISRALRARRRARRHVRRRRSTAPRRPPRRRLGCGPSDAVLVKGSRSVGAERVVAALTETWPAADNSATSGPHDLRAPLPAAPLRELARVAQRPPVRPVPRHRLDDDRDAHLLRALAVVHPRAAEEADRPGRPRRRDDPRGHIKKRGTPTMGGALLLLAVLGSTILWCDLRNIFVLAATAITAGYGVIGYLDDYLKIRMKNSKGLAARYKLLGQFLVAGAVLTWVFTSKEHRPAGLVGDPRSARDAVRRVREAPDSPAARALHRLRRPHRRRDVERRELHRRPRRPRDRPGDLQRRHLPDLGVPLGRDVRHRRTSRSASSSRRTSTSRSSRARASSPSSAGP